MKTHIFNTYRFTLMNDEKELVILEGKTTEIDNAALSFNPKMSDTDLLKTLQNFQIILETAIDNL